MSLPFFTPLTTVSLPAAPVTPPDEPGSVVSDSLVDTVIAQGKDELYRLLCLVLDPINEALAQHRTLLQEIAGYYTGENSVGIWDVAVLGGPGIGAYHIHKQGYAYVQVMSQSSLTLTINGIGVVLTLTLPAQQTYCLMLPDGCRFSSPSATAVNVSVHYTNKRFGVEV